MHQPIKFKCLKSLTVKSTHIVKTVKTNKEAKAVVLVRAKAEVKVKSRSTKDTQNRGFKKFKIMPKAYI